MGLIFLDSTLQPVMKTFTWPQTNQSSNKHMQIDKEGKWYRYAEWERNHTECRYISQVFGLLLLTPLSSFLNIIRTWQADITLNQDRYTTSATIRDRHDNMPSWHCHDNTPNKSQCIFSRDWWQVDIFVVIQSQECSNTVVSLHTTNREHHDFIPDI